MMPYMTATPEVNLIDVDDPDAAAALSRYGVGATPNTIITDPQGNFLQKKEGGMGKGDFLELLGKLNPSTINDLCIERHGDKFWSIEK